ncbi:MAG: hypothetical protein ACYDBT_07155 [Desulfobulbaceae bacterium]
MVFLFRLLLLVALIIPFPAWSVSNAAEVEDVRLIKEFAKGEIVSGGVMYHGSAYFLVSNDNANSVAIWQTDGTREHTVLVKRIEGETASRDNIITQKNSPTLPPEKSGEPLLLNDSFFFITEDAFSATQYLWQSDGTSEGTQKVTKIPVGCWGENDAVTMNDALYFLTWNCLWRTDGTETGTTMLSNAFFLGGSPIIYRNHLYFAAQDGHGEELWVSDGTASGTKILRDLNMNDYTDCLYRYQETDLVSPSSVCYTSSSPRNLIIFKDELFFTAYHSDYGRELWKTNGLDVQLVKDFNPGPDSGITESYLLSMVTQLNGKLLILADDGVHGRELWTSNGTRAGTELLLPGPEGGASGLLGQNSNTVFFTGKREEIYSWEYTTELWKTDGTANGTALVSRVGGELSPSPFAITVFDGLFHFQSRTIELGQLYLNATDGIRTRTILPRMNIGGDSAIFNNTLYLSVGNKEWEGWGDDIELWAINAFTSRMAKDLLPADKDGDYSSIPRGFLTMDNSLLFIARSSKFYGSTSMLFREGIFALTMRQVTLPWLKPLLLNDANNP